MYISWTKNCISSSQVGRSKFAACCTVVLILDQIICLPLIKGPTSYAYIAELQTLNDPLG